MHLYSDFPYYFLHNIIIEITSSLFLCFIFIIIFSAPLHVHSHKFILSFHIHLSLSAKIKRTRDKWHNFYAVLRFSNIFVYIQTHSKRFILNLHLNFYLKHNLLSLVNKSEFSPIQRTLFSCCLHNQIWKICRMINAAFMFHSRKYELPFELYVSTQHFERANERSSSKHSNVVLKC